MSPIVLKIDGIPIPWKAPRFSKGRCYDILANHKKSIVWALKSKFKGIPLTCPLRIDIFFSFPPPKSTSKKRYIQMISKKIAHTTYPDRSNCLKLIEDCLQKAGIIKNDSQIVAGETQKFYSEQGYTLIHIQPMEEYEKRI